MLESLSFRSARRGAVLLALLLALPVAAQDPAGADLEEQEAAARALELSRELAERQAAIEVMQSELGIYHPALIEAHSDLAVLFLELEDLENAVSSYGEALQLARINTGLYSEEQLRIIDALIDSHDSMQDWEQVDDYRELHHFIHSRLHEPADSRYLSAAAVYGAWKLRAVRENLLGLSSWGLINEAEDLSDFYARVIERAELRPELKSGDLLQMIFGKTEVDLALARSIASTPYTAFEGTASRYVLQTRCTNARDASGQVVRRCFSVQVENPRYRQSQRDAKQMALGRQTREVTRSLDRLRLIRDSGQGLSSGERQSLDLQIVQLQAESEQVLRAARRPSLF